MANSIAQTRRHLSGPSFCGGIGASASNNVCHQSRRLRPSCLSLIRIHRAKNYSSLLQRFRKCRQNDAYFSNGLYGTACMHCNSLTISTRASSRLTFSQQYNEAYRHHSSTTESQGKDKHVGIERSKINSGPRLSVAVVGAGPSGFYAAKYLTSSVLKRIQQVTQTTLAAGVGTDANDTRSTESEHEPSSVSSSPFAWFGIDVDIIERLPTPYGLVRYGVAPDHPEVKNVEKDFASLFV